MIESFISILIVCIIGAGAFFAAHYVLDLRNSRDTLAEEYKRAEGHISELESRIELLEAQIDIQRATPTPTGDSNGWGSFEARR